MVRSTILLGLFAAVAAAGRAGAQDIAVNDYPTVARADYVFACMAANGQTRDVLEKCSCSIDIIASIIPYKRYAEAEAVLSVVQIGGEKTTIFRTSKIAKSAVDDLRRAQVEAELRCF